MYGAFMFCVLYDVYILFFPFFFPHTQTKQSGSNKIILNSPKSEIWLDVKELEKSQQKFWYMPPDRNLLVFCQLCQYFVWIEISKSYDTSLFPPAAVCVAIVTVLAMCNLYQKN